MAYSSRFAHSACRKDYFRGLIVIYVYRIIAGDGYVKTGEFYRVYALVKQFKSLAVVIIAHTAAVYFGCFNRKRAVHINREIPVPFDKSFFLYYSYQIQKLLRSAHRKRGDNNIAASVKRFLYYARKLCNVIGTRPVQPVAVG